MANTWRAVATTPTWSTAAKSLLKVYNGAGSGVVLRVYRVWIINAQSAGVTGVLSPVQLVRISTSGSAGTTVTPVAHDTNNTALPAQVAIAHSDTTPGTVDATFRRALVSADEPGVGALTSDEMGAIIPFNLLWNGGYGDTNVEPITLREGYGVSVYTPGIASAAGITDVIIEFTSSAS